jgi:hypothetical protein
MKEVIKIAYFVTGVWGHCVPIEKGLFWGVHNGLRVIDGSGKIEWAGLRIAPHWAQNWVEQAGQEIEWAGWSHICSPYSYIIP